MTGGRVFRVVAFGLVSCHGAQSVNAAETPIAPEKPKAATPPAAPDPVALNAPEREASPEAQPAKAPARRDPKSAEEASLHREFDGAPALRTVRGQAAYYGDKFAGRKTASGERYDPDAFTAAHRSFSFGTIVRIKRTDTGDYTYVRVTDRGPFGEKARIIDVSKIAARRLDMLRLGVVDVRLEVVRWGDSARRR